MQNLNFTKNFLPHIIVTICLLVVAVCYCLPEATEGKVLEQSDNVQARGIQTEWRHYKEEKNEHILWTNQGFVGLPTYMILGVPDNTLLRPIAKIVLLGQGSHTTYAAMFWAMLAFYIGLSLMGFDWKFAALGGLLFGFMTNNILLIEAGHTTKFMALTYSAPIIGSLIYTFRTPSRWLLGGALFAFFLAMQIGANHIQITYYTMLMAGIYGIIVAAKAFREKTLGVLGKSIAILTVGMVLAFSANTARLWTAQEFASDTTRGKSELAGKEQGMGKGYAFNWSYGKFETLNLMIPGLQGGSNRESFLSEESKGSATEEALAGAQAFLKQRVTTQVQQGQIPKEQANEVFQNSMQQLYQSTSQYWGVQPGTSGPVYWGAVVVFLFFLGLFAAPVWARYWLGIGTAFLVMLAWGNNFQAVNYFLFDHFPLMNKFRAVTMALSVGQMTALMLGILGLRELLTSTTMEQKDKTRAVLLATAVSAGICVLIILVSYLTHCTHYEFDDKLGQYVNLDQDLKSNFGAGFVNALESDRAAFMRGDALRSLLFILLAAGALWAYTRGKFNGMLAFVTVAVLAFTDLLMVDLRYVNSTSWKDATETAAPAEGKADKQIKRMEANNPHYRVLDLMRGNPMASALSCYNHKSLGGYSAAKPMLMQEWADEYFLKDGRYVFMQHLDQLGMLNIKYVINQDQPIPLPQACGNAWFVDTVKVMNTADEELKELASLQPQMVALTNVRNAAAAQNLGAPDSLDAIRLASYHPEKMLYEYNLKNERFAVFSELYYPPVKGWNVYLDGNLVPEGFLKVNYLLRGMRLPAGKHQLEMRFEPKSYYTGSKISFIGSILVLVLLAGALFLYFRRKDEDGNEGDANQIVNYTSVTPTVVNTDLPASAPSKRK